MATFARPKVLYPGRFLAAPIFHIVVIYNGAELKSFVYIQYYVYLIYRVGYVSLGALQTSDQNKYTLCSTLFRNEFSNFLNFIVLSSS